MPAQVSAAFESYLERARSLDRLLGHDRAFALTPGGRIDRAAADRALGYLEMLYPGSIGEACLIDEHGREQARVTEGRPAARSELSSNEAENPFFAPTLRLREGQVYQAPPYVSPDTRAWVISNSTWIRLADRSRLIVHFEVSLRSFLPYVNGGPSTRHVAVIDRSNGSILLRDRTPLPATTAASPFPVTRWSDRFSTTSRDAGVSRVNGHPAVYRRIARDGGNANDWYVLEWSSAGAGLIPVWAGLATGVLGLMLLLVALADLRRQHGALRAAARLDHLTGLGNRKAVEEALDEALQAADHPDGARIAVLVIDLDGFKQINDTLGHDKGDVVLQEISRRLHANVFEYDTAGRLGGDEFAVVLRRVREVDDVAAVAHRLRDALIRPIDVDGVPRFIGASFGAALHPDHGRTSAELFRSADAAMYHAKRGREGVRVYQAGTVDGAEALGLAADLMTAVQRSELYLAFQPEYSLESGDIVAVEALARWQRADGVTVPPSDFIPLAERTGIIRSLTQLTLRLALEEAQRWHEHGVRVPISVNMSAHVVTDPSLPADISAMLDERGLTADALIIEVTETAAISDRNAAVKVLQQLRSIGIRIHLDDFGSGYASFGALQDLPLDGVKIDRNLVADQSQGEPRLLIGTIELARTLGLTVVAEGIENTDTHQLVTRLGCDAAQGYQLARPMAADAIRTLLTRSQIAAPR